MNVAQQMHHLAIVVADLDKSLQWYEEKLGFKLEKRFGFAEAGTEIAHILSDGGLRLEVISRADRFLGQMLTGTLLMLCSLKAQNT